MRKYNVSSVSMRLHGVDSKFSRYTDRRHPNMTSAIFSEFETAVSMSRTGVSFYSTCK